MGRNKSVNIENELTEHEKPLTKLKTANAQIGAILTGCDREDFIIYITQPPEEIKKSQEINSRRNMGKLETQESRSVLIAKRQLGN